MGGSAVHGSDANQLVIRRNTRNFPSSFFPSSSSSSSVLLFDPFLPVPLLIPTTSSGPSTSCSYANELRVAVPLRYRCAWLPARVAPLLLLLLRRRCRRRRRRFIQNETEKTTSKEYRGNERERKNGGKGNDMEINENQVQKFQMK